MKKSKNNGITLVALIVTIIILLILAGVAISALTQTGLFENTKHAKNVMENAQNAENETLKSYSNKVDKVIGSRESVTIDKEEYELLKNNTNFSEEEKIIGTWTDNKKIYRKVISMNNNTKIQGVAWRSFDLGLTALNIDYVVNIKLLNGKVILYPSSIQVQGNNLAIYIDTCDFYYFTKVILEYTKTTD